MSGLAVASPETRARESRAHAALDEARHEAELSRRRLEEVQFLTSVGSWEWDLSEERPSWSPELRQMAGLRPDEPVPTLDEFLKRIHPDDRDDFLDDLRGALESAGVRHYSYRTILPDGSEKLIESHARVETDDSGAPIRVFGAAQDITDRQRARTSLHLQADLLDQVAVAVIASDGERRLTHWNRAAEKMFGVTRANALGRSVDQVVGFPPESARLRDEMVAELGSGESWEGEILLEDAAGTTFPAYVTNAPVRELGGAIVGYSGVLMDLSEMKDAQAELRSTVAELERSRRETIHRLSRAVETRDLDTGSHIERIGELAASIGQQLGLAPDHVELLRIASPMHDVGKLGISDQILHKPGALTAEERTEMERHAEFGFEVLSGSESALLEMAAEIALTHHEKMDGSGYPRGLVGDQIPLEGRITAVVDVFDALISDRCYRPAMSVEQAVTILEEGRGSHFDPAPLDALLSNIATQV
jgi:putative two-component system response regulator